MDYNKAIVTMIDTLASMGISMKRAYIGGKSGRLEKGLYWHPLSQIDRGFQGRKYKIDGNKSGHKELQIIEQPIQITAYSANPQSYEESVFNIAENARMIVQSLPFSEAMKQSGIEVTRPTNLRTLQFINDSDNYEDEVSFQFSIIYTRSIEFNTPAVHKKKIDAYFI